MEVRAAPGENKTSSTVLQIEHITAWPQNDLMIMIASVDKLTENRSFHGKYLQTLF